MPELVSQIVALGIPELIGSQSNMEHALDTAYYTRLLAIAHAFPRQGELFTNFLLHELDNRNLFTMLRLRQAKLPVEEIRKQLLPRGKRFAPQLLLQWAALADEELTTALATRKIALDPNIAQFEVQYAKTLLDSAVLLLHQHPLSVDVILGYLFAKEIEMRNLRMIIMGKHLGMDEGFLEANLVLGG